MHLFSRNKQITIAGPLHVQRGLTFARRSGRGVPLPAELIESGAGDITRLAIRWNQVEAALVGREG